MNAVTAIILLRVYFTPDVTGVNPAEKKAIAYLLDRELIATGTIHCLAITSRGEALVKYWLDTPLPLPTTTWEITR